MNLWKKVKELEEQGLIAKAYFHPDYDTGIPQLNIEFKDIDWDKARELNLPEIDKCAYWE